MKIVRINNFDDLIKAYESEQIDTEELFLCIDRSNIPLVCFSPTNPITEEYKANVLIELKMYVDALKNGYEAPLFITGDASFGINVY